MNIQDRLMELLKERSFSPVFSPADESINWQITFYDKVGRLNIINSFTPVVNLWWLIEETEEKVSPFEAWLVELDTFFSAEFAMSHNTFEDYNWLGEFESLVSPQDAFDEWKNFNDSSTLGG